MIHQPTERLGRLVEQAREPVPLLGQLLEVLLQPAVVLGHGLALLLSLLDRANLVTSCVVRGGRCRSLTVIRMRSREGSRREASSRARLPLTACRLAMAFDSRRSRRWPSRYQTITRALCPI